MADYQMEVMQQAKEHEITYIKSNEKDKPLQVADKTIVCAEPVKV